METTNNQNEQLNNLSTGLKKAVALRQFAGTDYFFWKEVPYEGNLSNIQSDFSNEDEETRESGFDEYVKSNCVELEEIDDDTIQFEDKEYYVLTDSEADDRWEDYLINYIEDIIYSELPNYLRNYFDEERWKDDMRYDGRGSALAHYDGHENEEEVGGETFYIYRLN